jgi:hypothetical protein
MQHPTTEPTRWRALPTITVIVVAIALGAVTAKAATGPSHHAGHVAHAVTAR